MKKSIALIMALCLLMAGCAAKEPAPTVPSTAPTTAPTTVPTTQPTTLPTEPEDPTVPTEPVAPVATDPLTGEPLDAPYTSRPYAVVLNNAKQALPHWSVSECQMLWELPHEYAVTRMVAMYSDVSDVGRLGSMRSARPYHLSLAMSFDALFVHAGYSPHAKQALKDTGWETINGVEGKYGYKYFHRDQDRLDAGLALEHTMYTTGPEVLSYCEDMGYTVSADKEMDYGYQFAQDGTPVDGTDAKQIQILFKSRGKKTDLTYDETTGKYTMEQFGLTYVDGNDGSAVEFENVLVLRARVGLQPDSDYRLAVDLVGSDTGYYACGGKMIPIVWSRASESDPITYALEDGTPLTMGVGTTFAAVIYTGEGTVTAS